MNLSVGIVGLPNVGKSTLFNALLKKQAALAANYPFATIEPNVGIVPVPDGRLDVLAKTTAEELSTPGESGPTPGVLKLPPIKPATVEFVDIAGLVKGASEGAGLGNKFLSHIREVKIIAHVVRAFEDGNIVREGSVDPKTDYETIRTELALSDLATVSASKQKNKASTAILERIEGTLNENKNVTDLEFSKEELEFVKSLNLLSSKPEIIVLNVPEGDYTNEKIPGIIDKYSSLLNSGSLAPHPNPLPKGEGERERGTNFVVICAKIEEELASLSEEEQIEYLKDLGLETSGLERLIKKAYQELGLISFLTCGEIEVRAWTIKKGSTAPEAAGEIHTDFIKNFIKAEVVAYDDFISLNGWKAARANGKARMEGRDYVMSDGDVVEFKIGR